MYKSAMSMADFTILIRCDFRLRMWVRLVGYGMWVIVH